MCKIDFKKFIFVWQWVIIWGAVIAVVVSVAGLVACEKYKNLKTLKKVCYQECLDLDGQAVQVSYAMIREKGKDNVLCPEGKNKLGYISDMSIPFICCKGKDLDNKVELKDCRADQDCDPGYICYNSQLCGPSDDGLDCGAQKGDLKCHQECQQDSDCLDSNYNCQQRIIWRGDTASAKSFCLDKIGMSCLMEHRLADYRFIDQFDNVETAEKWCNQCLTDNKIPDWSYDGGPFCNQDIADADQECTDSKDCQGWCVADDVTQTMGACSRLEIITGCYPIIENNETHMLCFD